MPEKLESQGVVLRVDDDSGSPSTFLAIGNISGISGPSGSASEIDVTDLDSVAREFLMGLPDEGEISLDMFWAPGTVVHDLLFNARKNRTKKNFRLELTDSPTTIYNFFGFVTGLAQNTAVDEAITAALTIRITGAILKM